MKCQSLVIHLPVSLAFSVGSWQKASCSKTEIFPNESLQLHQSLLKVPISENRHHASGSVGVV